MTTIGKGRKQCKKCEEIVGARSTRCSKCQAVFKKKPTKPVVKRKKKAAKKVADRVAVDWTTLRAGDLISVRGGPIYSGATDDPQGMGYRGIFRVYSLMDNGIGAYPQNNKFYSGFCFLYMGKKGKSKETGISRRPHIIKKMIKNEN